MGEHGKAVTWRCNKPASKSRSATGFCGPGWKVLWCPGEQGGCWDTGPLHSPVEGRTQTAFHSFIHAAINNIENTVTTSVRPDTKYREYQT